MRFFNPFPPCQTRRSRHQGECSLPIFRHLYRCERSRVHRTVSNHDCGVCLPCSGLILAVKACMWDQVKGLKPVRAVDMKAARKLPQRCCRRMLPPAPSSSMKPAAKDDSSVTPVSCVSFPRQSTRSRKASHGQTMSRCGGGVPRRPLPHPFSPWQTCPRAGHVHSLRLHTSVAPRVAVAIA